jgi:hypothetical protein
MCCCIDYYNFRRCLPLSARYASNWSDDATKIARHSSRHQAEYSYGVGLLPVSVEKTLICFSKPLTLVISQFLSDWLGRTRKKLVKIYPSK